LGKLLWGSTFEVINFVATDASGNVYVSGSTGSSNAISTVGSYQSAFGSGFNDAFLAKFNSAGVRQWATYYGGSGNEDINSIAFDAAGNVYVSGTTNSSNAISTVGSYQATFAGGASDAFIAKFNTSGIISWATYYGGIDQDISYGIQVDQISGNVYLAGVTKSTSSISTIGSQQPVHAGGSDDGFLVQFNSSGVRQWGTYCGGSGSDYAFSTAIDPSTGDVYLTGYTGSTNGISTIGCHQSANAGGNDGFLVKYTSVGVRIWGTYYGGTGNDNIRSVGVDASGNVSNFTKCFMEL
jgi:hypothetical protein